MEVDGAHSLIERKLKAGLFIYLQIMSMCVWKLEERIHLRYAISISTFLEIFEILST